MSRIRWFLTAAIIASIAGTAAAESTETSVRKSATQAKATPASTSPRVRVPTSSDEARASEWDRQRAGVGTTGSLTRPPRGYATTSDEARDQANYLQQQVAARGDAPIVRAAVKIPTTTDEARGL